MKLKLLIIFFAISLVIPIATWFLYKPVRVFFPELAGMKCVNKNICVENIQKLDVAENLYIKAENHVTSTLSTFKVPPKFIFCKTQKCFESFGFKKASAQGIGTVATVVGPNGWKSYIIEHEMIHHIQNEKLGSIKFASLPTWFVEGMAYSLSQDPRTNLSEPWESHRRTFKQWYKEINPASIWIEAAKL